MTLTKPTVETKSALEVTAAKSSKHPDHAAEASPRAPPERKITKQDTPVAKRRRVD